MCLGNELDGMYFLAKLEWTRTRYGSVNNAHTMWRITEDDVRYAVLSSQLEVRYRRRGKGGCAYGLVKLFVEWVCHSRSLAGGEDGIEI